MTPAPTDSGSTAKWRDASWVYIPAASHNDSSAFRDRQKQRLQEAQSRPANVKPLRKVAK